jgi:Rrf2 family protein
MRLSSAAEFAIRGVAVLAEEYGRGPIPLEIICRRRQGLAREYLVKIFGSLVKAGIVRTVRGKKGGFLLARKPKDITLLEVIEAVEGPIALNYCQHEPPRCDEYDCPLRDMWRELQGIVREKLGSVTLATCTVGQEHKAGQSGD